jgi:dephospho-CoA kinase
MTKSATMRLGITGGIGSGKSTVCGLLAQKGIAVIDADAISRGCTAPGGAALPAIAQAFGDAVFEAPGILNRDAMRALVFDQAQARAQLQALLHPMIAAEIERQATQAAASSPPCIAFDIPLLVESKRWRPVLDRVLVIDCQAQTQIDRVVQRSGLTPQSVQKIMAAQSSRAARLQCADFVLFNESVTIDEIDKLLRAIFPFLEISSRHRKNSA